MRSQALQVIRRERGQKMVALDGQWRLRIQQLSLNGYADNADRKVSDGGDLA
jgi:hypothetical protein